MQSRNAHAPTLGGIAPPTSLSSASNRRAIVRPRRDCLDSMLAVTRRRGAADGRKGQGRSMEQRENGKQAGQGGAGRMGRAAWGMGLALVLAASLGAQALPELTAQAPPAPVPGAGATVPAGAVAEVYGISPSADPVGPGDVLAVQVYGQPQLSGSLRVGPNGVIAPPFLAPLQVAGEPPQRIEQRLRRAYATMLLHPLVSVRLLENNSRRVSINGAVPRPGVYAFSGELSLLQALALAGGVDPVKASPEVLLFHQPPVTSRRAADGRLTYTANTVLETIDLNRIPADPGLNRLLRPGDVIDVQEAQPVYISGDVMRPGMATLGPGLTLTQLISASGGFLPQADTAHVRVLRLLPDGQRRTLVVNVARAQHNRGPDLALEANDIVLVPGSLLRMTGLELLDFFTGTERWRVQQTVANRVP
jgi:polysaccharide export outer membrane protein